MADFILAAAARQRPVIEGGKQTGELNRIIRKFVGATLYRDTARVTAQLRHELTKALAKKYLPYARAVGRSSASPILAAIPDRLIDKSSATRRAAMQYLKRYQKANLLAFRAELAKELGTLSGEVEAAFARGYRDGVARKQIIADLVSADRAELKQLAKVRKEIAKASEAVRAAEAKAAKAGKRTVRKARRKVREARKELTKAKAKIRTTKSFYARFETNVQAHARDTIRREAQRAQEAAFREQGFTGTSTYIWVAVNGSDACPQCSSLHGASKKLSDWAGSKPGDGQTYCGSACMCQLIPDAYKEGAPIPDQPLRMP